MPIRAHTSCTCTLIRWLFLSLILSSSGSLDAQEHASLPMSHISIGAYHRSFLRISDILQIKDLSFGAPVLIRIFKEENELELWMQDEKSYELYKTYIICFKSGEIGPKLKEGDRQSPEGFYRVGYDQMNPWSDFHLAFNLGYPNEYDLFYDRTGSALMVHGRCSSDGCFAMTDYYMDEIYTLVNEALSKGQEAFQVHIFPFRLTDENLNNHRGSPWYPFWSNLKEGFDFFESYRIPPQISVVDGRYLISPPLAKEKLVLSSR